MQPDWNWLIFFFPEWKLYWKRSRDKYGVAQSVLPSRSTRLSYGRITISRRKWEIWNYSKSAVYNVHVYIKSYLTELLCFYATLVDKQVICISLICLYICMSFPKWFPFSYLNFPQTKIIELIHNAYNLKT